MDKITKISDKEVGNSKTVKIGDKHVSAAKFIRHGSNMHGRKVIDVDDPVARRLRELSMNDIFMEAATLLNVTTKSLKEKYSHLNQGMQRMTLGNLIRGAKRKLGGAPEVKTKSATKPATKPAVKSAAKPMKTRKTTPTRRETDAIH